MDDEITPSEDKIIEWERTVSHIYVRARDEGLLAVPDEDEERVEELIEFLERVREDK